MAIYTSILTGGVSNHETTSEEVNGVYTDFVNEGVVGTVGNSSGVAPATGAFAVNAQGTPAMAVDVSAGVAYVEGVPTSQNAQTFRIKNTATEAVSISANASGSTKYDWVYIYLSAANLNAPNSAGDNVATLTTSRSTSASADDGTPPTYGYAIAVVTVANGASSITNGNIRDIRSQVTLDTGVTVGTDGWTTLDTILTTATGYNKGNREFELTSSEDLTSTLSPGMRLKIARGTTPPTQCLDLELASSQYATKTSPAGLSFTDDFTTEAWVKLESYGTRMGIVCRRNANTEGWSMQLSATGTVELIGLRIASNNRTVSSYQSIPLNRWVHVAATLDMSGNSGTIYIDGASVPTVMSTNGTATALVQGTTALAVGTETSAGTNLFDGKLADVRVWSAIRTATEIRDNQNQQLVGNEANLVAYYKLDGDLNDSTSNANNLTGSGGAVATNADNPMKATEYGIVTKVTASKLTVFTGTDHNIPNMTLSAPHYSTQKSPFGFPTARNKWEIVVPLAVNFNTVSQSFVTMTYTIFVPIGAWYLRSQIGLQIAHAAGGTRRVYITLSSNAATETNKDTTALLGYALGTQLTQTESVVSTLGSVDQTADTTYTLIGKVSGTATTVTIMPDVVPSYIKAECAYL